MHTMLMEERRQKIMEQLALTGSVQVSALAEQLGVTSETIRKDLAHLESQGLVIRGHGGAILKQNAIELSFGLREQENVEDKALIAQKAIELIPESSSVIVCTGSTTLELARLIALRSGLKVFTDSLPVASALISSHNQVFLFGGELRPQSFSLCGGWTVSQIRLIQADLCFMGTDGFSNISGPSTPSFSDAFVDSEILKQSEKSYILADHTKFSKRSLYKICDWQSVTGLITDRKANPKAVTQLQNLTQVICA